MTPPARILIIELSNIGDAILTLPALSDLFQAHPAAEIHMLCSPRVADLFSKDPRVFRIWLWKKERSFVSQAAFIFRLSLKWFNLVVDFRHSLIPFFLLGAKRAPILWRGSIALHRADRHLQVVRKMGIAPSSSGGSSLWIGQEDEREIRRFLSDRPLVVVSPGARSHLKRWPALAFAELADRLIEEDKVQVLLVGEVAERSIAREVAASMRHPVSDLSGQTTFPQLAALLRKANLVITNDSACLHTADAMGTPTVAIFGPTDPEKYGPRHPRAKVVRLRVVCAPCERALCPYQHECMRWLGTQEVYQAAKDILSGNS